MKQEDHQQLSRISLSIDEKIETIWDQESADNVRYELTSLIEYLEEVLPSLDKMKDRYWE